MSGVSFLALLVTQLLTAINDNVFRWLAIGVGKDYVDGSQVGIILTAGTACFVLPYLVLAAPAGYLADRLSKRTVIVGCKVAEIIIMALGSVAIAMQAPPLVNVICLFTVVALMGAQSALFSPSKMGIIPELLRPEKISAANGLFGLTTVSATVIGMAIGSWLSRETGFRGQERWWLSAAVLLSLAIAGYLASLPIPKLPVANPGRTFPWNAALQTWRDLRLLASNRVLLRVALGVVFFWSVGALAQLNVDQFAFEAGALYETDKVPLLLALVVGVGFGSVLAGIWSGERIELGILPLGAFGVAVCSMLLFTVVGDIIEPSAALTPRLAWAFLLLFGLGTSAGLFSVPLDAYMQYRSPPQQRGSVLAAMNFLVFLGILLAAFLFAGLRRPTFPGSLDNIALLRASVAGMSSQEHRELDELVGQFTGAWQAASGRTDAEGGGPAPPDLLEYIDRASPAVREPALANLLWVEWKQRQSRGEAVDKTEYYELFVRDTDKQMAKDVFDQTTRLPLLSARQIFLLAGIFTFPVFFYIVFLIPQASIRFVVWLASHTVYRIRVVGRENLPERGGVLLVANHVTWLDGILLLLTTSRPVRILAFATYFRGRLVRALARLAGVILVAPESQEVKAAIESARRALRDGEIVGVFPEGSITRSGQLESFRPRLLKIPEGIAVPVIPVYLDELWGSIFSFEGGRFFWKRPRRWPYPISIHFGPPVSDAQNVYQVRRAVQELGATAVEQRVKKMSPVTMDFIRSCKKQLFRSKAADSMGTDMTGGSLLMRTLILRRLLRRGILAPDENAVGLLLPPSVPAMVANAALSLDRRVTVNLNYTVSREVMQQCIEQAGIRHVLTSRRVMEKLGITQLGAELVMLEDLRDRVTLGDKLSAALATYVVPSRMLIRSLNLGQCTSDDLITIIFTSGSTGEPKGVMLTHGNVASNVEAVQQLVRLEPSDVLLGILPFFHSFGYTITMWTVLALNVKGAYHFNPLDARQIGSLCKEHGVTILLSTPTFLRSYLRRCEREEFRTIDVVITGAERLPRDVADAFEEQFGVRPVEGYGCTETAPLAAVNIPPSRRRDTARVDAKEGTVGRPIPGVAAKTLHLDSGVELGPGKSGMLLIKGPNIMKGYLGKPQQTADVIRDGWYVTGDVAEIDEDGFIKITGRISRFSKIGGEMVPHIQVEETLASLLGHADEGFKAVVTAVSDRKKGERLVVVHTKLDRTPADLCKGLSEAGLPNIFIPSPDSFVEVLELPVLGTGKLDLKRVNQIAKERFCEP